MTDLQPDLRKTGGMYKQFQTDESLEKTGVELLYDGFRVTIARMGGANKDFSKTFDRKTKPYRRAIETGTASSAVLEKITIETVAETVVLNWEVEVDGEVEGERVWKRGIEAEDGSILDFTVANVIQTFENLPELALDIVNQAKRAELFRKDIRELEAGNLSTS